MSRQSLRRLQQPPVARGSAIIGANQTITTLLGVQLQGGGADDLARMRLERGGRDGERRTDRRSGIAVCFFGVGAGVLVAVGAGLVAGLVPALGGGVSVVLWARSRWSGWLSRSGLSGLLRAVSAGVSAILMM